MSIHKKKLDWCLASETRMKKIQPDEKLSREHINKAKHNFVQPITILGEGLAIGEFHNLIIPCITPY